MRQTINVPALPGLGAFGPDPALGVTPDVIAARGFTVAGLQPERPYRGLAFGALYFGIVGLGEIFGRNAASRFAGSMRP